MVRIQPQKVGSDNLVNHQIPTFQDTTSESRAPSLTSLPPTHVLAGDNASETSHTRPKAASEPNFGRSLPVSYTSAEDRAKAPWPGRPNNATKRIKTFMIPETISADAAAGHTATDQDRRLPLNLDDPVTWAIDHHHDHLLRKISDVDTTR